MKRDYNNEIEKETLKDIQYLQNKMISTSDENLRRAIEVKLNALKGNNIVLK